MKKYEYVPCVCTYVYVRTAAIAILCALYLVK